MKSDKGFSAKNNFEFSLEKFLFPKPRNTIEKKKFKILKEKEKGFRKLLCKCFKALLNEL